MCPSCCVPLLLPPWVTFNVLFHKKIFSNLIRKNFLRIPWIFDAKTWKSDSRKISASSVFSGGKSIRAGFGRLSKNVAFTKDHLKNLESVDQILFDGTDDQAAWALGTARELKRVLSSIKERKDSKRSKGGIKSAIRGSRFCGSSYKEVEATLAWLETVIFFIDTCFRQGPARASSATDPAHEKHPPTRRALSNITNRGNQTAGDKEHGLGGMKAKRASDQYFAPVSHARTQYSSAPAALTARW